MKQVIMGFVLGVAGLLAFANTAAACTEECQMVSPNCRRCINTGGPTNQTCRNSGGCNCIYTNLCFGLTAAQSTGVEPVEEAATCSDTAASFEFVAVGE